MYAEYGSGEGALLSHKGRYPPDAFICQWGSIPDYNQARRVKGDAGEGRDRGPFGVYKGIISKIQKSLYVRRAGSGIRIPQGQPQNVKSQ